MDSERGAVAALPSGKLGMWVFLVTDAMSFGGLLTAYGTLRAGAAAWPRPGAWLDVPVAAIMTFVLLGSSVTMALAADADVAGRARAARGFVAATIALGLLFLGGQAFEYATLARHGVGFARDLSASTFFVCTGWHGLHVAIGVGWLAGKALGARGRLETAALFWHFLDAMWILIFTVMYLV